MTRILPGQLRGRSVRTPVSPRLQTDLKTQPYRLPNKRDIRYTKKMLPLEFFAALANDTRLRCMMLLSRHEELCVCELTHALDASQPHISRHLAHLRASGFVVDRREGLWVFYRINPALPDWTKAALRETAWGIAESPPFSKDDQTLLSMPTRPNRTRCA